MGSVIVGSGPAYLNRRLSVAVKDFYSGTTVQTVFTDATGFWGVTLTPGTYQVVISGTGISTYISDAVKIRTGTPTRQDATVVP